MTVLPKPFDCGTHLLRQIVLTSVNAQLDWQSATKVQINFTLFLKFSKYYPKGSAKFALVQVNEVPDGHSVSIKDL